MTSLLLQAKTAKSLSNVQKGNLHALIVTGPGGSGKATVAKYLISRLLNLNDPAKLIQQPFYLLITPDKTTIGIEQIRDLQHFLSLKTTGTAKIRRAVIIQDAHLMTQEAQNSLLKSLEEPPADTIIVLTTVSLLSLLPTVRSRAQAITVLPVSFAEALQYFTNQGFEQAQIERDHMLSEGYVGLLSALLHKQQDHQLFAQIEQAKQLLTAVPFERLRKVYQLSKDKEELPMLFHSLKLVCKTALMRGTNSNPNQSSKLIASLRLIEQTERAFFRAANNKLLLTNLFLNL